jgi:hypothetical protein
MCDCVCCTATKHSQAQLDNFDDDLPLHSLVMFRRMAEAQAHKEKLTQRQQAAAAAATAAAAAAKDSQQAQTATAATAKPPAADTSSTAPTAAAAAATAAAAPVAAVAAAAKPAVAATKSWFGSMFSKKKAAGTGTGGGGATAGAGDSSGDEAEEGDVVLDDLVTDAIQVIARYFILILYYIEVFVTITFCCNYTVLYLMVLESQLCRYSRQLYRCMWSQLLRHDMLLAVQCQLCHRHYKLLCEAVFALASMQPYCSIAVLSP